MFRFFRTPRRMEDLALFSRHVAGAMAVRAPLPDILRAYVKDGEGGPLERALGPIAQKVEMGGSLADAMDEHTAVFPASYRRMVRLGEQSRTLAGLMRQVADRMEEGLKTYEHFRRSAAYPFILMIVLYAIITFLMLTIAPKWEAIFNELGAPWATQWLFGFQMRSVLLCLNLILLVPTVYLLAVLLGLHVWGFGQGRLALSIPIIGPIMRLSETANFANYLSLLLESRVPLPEALGLLADTSPNLYVRAAIEDFRRRCEAGESLASMIQNQPLFPASMAVMIASAEDQGELAQTLRHLGLFYQDRTTHGLLVLREIMEPLMLILIGIFLALVVVAFYGPLFSIPKLIG